MSNSLPKKTLQDNSAISSRLGSSHHTQRVAVRSGSLVSAKNTSLVSPKQPEKLSAAPAQSKLTAAKISPVAALVSPQRALAKKPELKPVFQVRQIEVDPFINHSRAELAELDRQILAPSMLTAVSHAAKALVGPLAVAIIVSGLAVTFTGKSPLSYLDKGVAVAAAVPTTPTAQKIVAAESTDEGSDFEDTTTGEDAVEVETAALVQKQVFEPSADVDDQIGQIKFIAGMIAVHQPKIGDCGAVAKEIVSQSSGSDLDPFYVAAIISIESRFGANERSYAGAMGMMQLLPGTAREVALRRMGTRSNPVLTDVHTNIKLGIAYIKELEKRYHGNRFYALAAYNWGPANVDRARAGTLRIPGSVKNYANTIIDRSARWRSHFDKAKESALALSESFALSTDNS